MFQTHVNRNPAPATAGDFAGSNPRASVPAGDGQYVAGADPLIVGRFAWFNPNTGKAESNAANGGILAFVHRENQTIITAFLGEARVAVEEGFPVTGMVQGEFWADFGTAGGSAGDPVYANDTTGVAQVDPTGATLTNFVLAQDVPVPAVTDANTDIAANTGVMTVAAMASGVLEVGQSITWAGKDPNAYVTIYAQLTGTPGGAGTYQTTYRNRPAVNNVTVTGTAGTLGKISSWIQPSP